MGGVFARVIYPWVYTQGYMLSLLQSSLYELRLTKDGAINRIAVTFYDDEEIVAPNHTVSWKHALHKYLQSFSGINH